jgi:hypothetical protein
MRRGFAGVLVVAASLTAASARAEGPDPSIAVVVGAATLVAGFTVGGALMATTAHANPAGDSPWDNGKNIAGWFAMESGFVLAPLLAHGIEGEWARGGVLAAIPAATTVATIPIFLQTPGAVAQATIPQERWMLGLFCAGMAASVAGVVDAAFAPGRTIHLVPSVGPSSAGLVLGGEL